MKKSTTTSNEGETGKKQLDDVLRRMLSTPPKPHQKPAKKIVKKKPAK